MALPKFPLIANIEKASNCHTVRIVIMAVLADVGGGEGWSKFRRQQRTEELLTLLGVVVYLDGLL
jgi:hypothetical protein